MLNKLIFLKKIYNWKKWYHTYNTFKTALTVITVILFSHGTWVRLVAWTSNFECMIMLQLPNYKLIEKAKDTLINNKNKEN